jgi:hypothetical protein
LVPCEPFNAVSSNTTFTAPSVHQTFANHEKSAPTHGKTLGLRKITNNPTSMTHTMPQTIAVTASSGNTLPMNN